MSVPRWMQPQSPQDKGRKAEKKMAKKVGGRAQPASGATPLYKEDITTATHLIQVKTTTKKSYTIKLKDLEDLRTNALRVGKRPALFLHIGDRSWKILEGIVLE